MNALTKLLLTVGVVLFAMSLTPFVFDFPFSKGSTPQEVCLYAGTILILLGYSHHTGVIGKAQK